MKIKIFILQIIMFSCLNLFSQTTSNVLKVQGESVIFTTPEEMHIYIPLISEDPDYYKCSDRLVKNYNYLVEILTASGIEKEVIKTDNINIEENFSWEQEGIWEQRKRVLIGYKGSIGVNITLKYTPEKLTKILNTLKSNENKYTYRIEFQLSKKQKNELLEKAIKIAVEDANLKAKYISESLNLKLLEIKEINFGYNSISDENLAKVEIFSISLHEETVSDKIVLNPEQIEIRKTIGIIWEVQK